MEDSNLLDIFSLVLVCDRNISATGLEIDRATLTKLFVINGEGEFQNTFNIIIPVDC